MSSHCEACLTRPVIEAEYKPQGKHEKIGDLDVYITGASPSTATKGVVTAYDIFGYQQQTLLGADLLASNLGPEAVVLVPDFFRGETPPKDFMQLPQEERRKVMGEFLATKAEPGKNVQALAEFMPAAKETYKNVKGWAVFGLCWGGKITAIAGGSVPEFKAAGTAHPGRLDPADAKALKVPYICLFSKEDGTPELMEEYAEALRGNNSENYVEKYGTMIHGWMGARADFGSDEVKKEFERGYKAVGEFFGKFL